MNAPEPRGFRQLPHTADAGFEVWAENLPALYAEAALALFALMGRPTGVTAAGPCLQTSAGVDREDLLVRLLSDLLARFELEGLWVADVREVVVNTAEDGDLVATLSGAAGRVDVDREPGLVEIKAVTYHGLRIREENGTLRARVLVDL